MADQKLYLLTSVMAVLVSIRQWHFNCVVVHIILQMLAMSTPVLHWYVGHIGETRNQLLTGYNQTMICFEKNEFHNLRLNHFCTNTADIVMIC